ncbi:hypothetical protein PO81_22450, partial [Vibrio parahaemolyticus]
MNIYGISYFKAYSILSTLSFKVVIAFFKLVISSIDFEAFFIEKEGIKNLLLTKKFNDEGEHLAFGGH